MKPDVSVVIPTYNRHDYLKQAITSCFAGNEDIDVEVVVVDDGSTDGTREYLDNLSNNRVRPIFQEHQGAQVARNAGQRAARGQTIKHVDDDDYLCPGALTKEFKTLMNSGADICYGHFYTQNDESPELSHPSTNPPHSDFTAALLSQSINRLQLAMLFRASSIEDLCWDESLEFLQDVNFMMRAAARGMKATHIDETVAVHRVHRSHRISDARLAADVKERICMKCKWYKQAFDTLKKRENLTPERREAVATGLWMEVHKLAPFSWKRAAPWVQYVSHIAPDFTPARSSILLRALDKLLSPAVTERITVPIRQLKLNR